MNQNIEEKATIIIDGEEKLNETRFSLNTAQSGAVDYVTNIIRGDLKSILISTSSAISIKISLYDFPDVVLFQMSNFVGQKYLPLRTNALWWSAENFEDGPVCWYLNDKLKVEVKGQLNTIVDFVVRWC